MYAIYCWILNLLLSTVLNYVIFYPVCVCDQSLHCFALFMLFNTHTIQLKSPDGCTVLVEGTETHRNTLSETKQPRM